VVKNKLAPPFREVEFDILYGQGISRSGDVLDLGAELGIIEKSGAWFSFGGERIGQGRENAKAYLEQHPEAIDKVEAMILTKHEIKRGGAASLTAIPQNGAPHGAADEKALKRSGAGSKPAN
jgi:recombination protein RecA